MKNKVKYITVFFLLVSVVIYADGGVPIPSPAPGPGLPIDGFTSVLLIFGALYGAYKIKKK